MTLEDVSKLWKDKYWSNTVGEMGKGHTVAAAVPRCSEAYS